MSIETIRIAGAGLAGLSAAIGLARRGHRVEVYEKNADSGMVRHPEWDAIENWTTDADLLMLLGEWGMTPSFEHRAPLSFEVYDREGRCYPAQTPRPMFYLLKRGPEAGSIEQSLKQQALDLGVIIHYGQPSARQEVDIWAAGSQHRGFFLGAGMTFRTTAPDMVLGLVSTLDAPKAYAYLVVVEGQGTVSVVLTRDFKQARTYLERSLELFRQAKGFDMEDLKMTSGFGGLASAFWQPTTARPIVIGEAAGFQDFLWGFGIRHALHSGHLAARAVHEGLDYQTLAEREIRPLVRVSMVNRMFYDWAGDRTYRILVKNFAASPDLPATMRRWYRGFPFHHWLWPMTQRRYRHFNEQERDLSLR